MMDKMGVKQQEGAQQPMCTSHGYYALIHDYKLDFKGK
jgi:hypothetical protein